MTFVDGVARPIGETRESIWQTEVDDVFVNTPPVGPATGYRLIIGQAPTGAFGGHIGEIAEWSGTAWVFTVPRMGTASTVKAVGIETPYIQSALAAPWVWDKLNPGGSFGAELHYEEDLTTSSTSSGDWQTKLTLVTDPLPLGNYIIFVAAVLSGTQNGTQIGGKMTYDGGERGGISLKPNVADGEALLTLFDLQFNQTGIHTVTMEWRRDGGGGNATIRGVRIALWRMS